MLHATFDEKTAQAAWFLQHKRRWPLACALALGLSATATSLLFGFGVAAARSSLPESTATFMALKRPLPPAKQNAAPLWDAAALAFAPWTGGNDQNPDMPDSWKNPALYDAQSPVRAYLASNAAAIAAADRAATFPHADWDLDYAKGYGILLPFLAKQRALARLCRTRARIAAFDNDWKEVLAALHTGHTAGVHAAEEPILVNYLVYLAIEDLAANTLIDALAAPRALPDAEIVERLIAFTRHVLRNEPRLSPAFVFERNMGLLALDRFTSGDLEALIALGSPQPSIELAPMFNPLGMNYFSDRATLEASFERSIAWMKRAEADPTITLDHQLLEAAQTRQGWGSMGRIISDQILPIIERCKSTFLVRRARWRAVLVCLLAYRHAHTHGGDWPEQLRDLPLAPDEFMDSCDPSGAPLRYRIDKNGQLSVWTVGADNKDNGGTDPNQDECFVLPAQTKAPSDTKHDE